MKKVLFFAALFYLCSCSKTHEAAVTKTFVLVHGAWQAPFAWEYVGPELEAAGQKVVIVQLPGHGTDTTNPATLTLDDYRDAVINAMNAAGVQKTEKVILVGHSLAGMIISEVAEKIPAQIDKLVYIGAYLPANGTPLIAYAKADTASWLGPAIIPEDIDPVSGLPGLLGVPLEEVDNLFCQDGNAAVKTQLVNNYRDEPGPPFFIPPVLTAENFGKADKYYIHTLQDHVVSPSLQNAMIEAAGIPSSKVFPINSSHSPFLSKPDSVTAILLNLTRIQ